eukprot:COSAG04_NODE_10205_length_796_cov_1.233859_1_plen_126_part_10
MSPPLSLLAQATRAPRAGTACAARLLHACRSLQDDGDAGEGYAPDDDRYNPDGDEYRGAHGYGRGEMRRSLAEDDGQEDADGYGPDADGYGAGYGGEHSEVRRALTESDGYGAEGQGYAEGEGYAD